MFRGCAVSSPVMSIVTVTTTSPGSSPEHLRDTLQIEARSGTDPDVEMFTEGFGKIRELEVEVVMA